MSPVRRALSPIADPASYRRLAFVASALPLAALWLALLITGWTLAAALVFTPLVVPLLLGLGIAVRAGAAVEAWLLRHLLGADVRHAGGRRATSFWDAPRAVLGDGGFWRAQVYLLLRVTVGFAAAVAVVSLLASALFLIAAPAFYWSFDRGFGPAGYPVDTLPEALSLVPLGLAALLAAAWLLALLARAWRRLGSALLDQRSSLPTALADTKPQPAFSPVWRGVRIHAQAVAGVNMVLILIWALTSPGGYFWPVWPTLSLGAPLAIHAWIEFVNAHKPFWWRRRLDAGFAIHAGVWAVLLLFLTCIWALTSPGGYFWPMWPMLLALIAVAPHALALLSRTQDRARMQERIASLETSRAGAVDLQENELRRIERDLHDGAQARLVALGMSIGMAEQKLATDTEAARELLAEARAGAGEALRELRDLARGIHPPVLADRGLDAAVRALAAVSPISVTVSATLPSRPSAPVESAAYFVVAEALANAGKHAQASRVDVRIMRSGEQLSVEIHDDGVGGADAQGSGLRGLRSRVEALDGTLTVVSPQGGPTTIRAELPCEW